MDFGIYLCLSRSLIFFRLVSYDDFLNIAAFFVDFDDSVVVNGITKAVEHSALICANMSGWIWLPQHKMLGPGCKLSNGKIMW